MPKTVDQIIDEVQSDIDELTHKFEDYVEGGLKIHEILIFLFQAGSKLSELMDSLQDVTGEQKKEVVMTVVRRVYEDKDPDIPWVPEPLETKLEEFFLDKVLGAFIEFIVRRRKEGFKTP